MLPALTRLTPQRIKLCVLILVVASCALMSDRVLIGRVSATSAAMGAASPAPMTFVVTNLNDSGSGSLRQAILDANANVGADTIAFQAGLTGTITLVTGQLAITDALTITGPGANVLAISGNNASRVFNVSAGVAVTITGLTITKGKVAGFGGGIRSQGPLTLTNCHITGNMATGLVGGGGVSLISADGTFTGCTFSDNAADNQGGGIDFISIAISRTLTLVNCTITGNLSDIGGGIEHFCTNTVTETTTLQVNNCTIANNTSTSGDAGGISTNFRGITRLRSTIIANNTLPNLTQSAAVAVTSQGFNLASDNGSGFLNQATDILNTNPLLGPLANNGGPTPTLALLAGSPALDKGISNGLTTDQRGFPRTVDLLSVTNAVGGDGTDIGAFEFQFSDLSAAALGPGAAVPATVPLSDQKAGSVLFYNYYSSSPTNLNAENTRLNLTNIDPLRSVAVHLFFVDGTTCSPADAFVCLTPSQTISFLASDFDPGTTGYMVAVAVDQNGCPINFNFLIGDEFIKLASGHTANLGAESFASISNVNICAPGALTATLNFDGISYNAAPRVLALDNFPSPLEANTLLIINRFGGNLLSGASTIGPLSGVLYDEAEQAFSFAFTPPSCQFKGSLSSTLRVLGGGLNQVVGAGRSGWLRFWAVDDRALLGAALILNSNSGANSFSGGHNLHKLTLTTSASLTIPIIAPGC